MASDDDLTVYAQNQKAVLITHDVEFSQRRRRNVIGRHLFLRCAEWEAAELLATLLDEILPILERREDIWVKLSVDGHRLSFDWK